MALLFDTLHNLTDALRAIPFWTACALGRRSTSRKFTFGLGRAEDLGWWSLLRFRSPPAASRGSRLVACSISGHWPRPVGDRSGAHRAAGNELVAQYRIRVGRRISSEALIAGGQHARADALTSLAVVAAAGVGAALGADWVDPVAGLLVAEPKWTYTMGIGVDASPEDVWPGSPR